MSVATLQHKQLGKDNCQKCPLCGEMQEIFVQGTITTPERNGVHIKQKGKGYSFCNCSNIFFTDWKNIRQSTYDENYYSSYQKPEYIEIARKHAQVIIPKMMDASGIDPYNQTVLEIGSISDAVLDEFKREGYYPVGLDLFSHPSKYTQIIGDFESREFLERFDVIWASHVFEHFKDPVEMIEKCYSLLNRGGVIYITMPDPWFVHWGNPHLWSHWHCEEHHILWDMDSFIDVAIDAGFELVWNERSICMDVGAITGDMRIIMRKP